VTGPIAGVVIAGGRSERMGDRGKASCLLGGQTLLERVIDRLRPQVDSLLLNVNDDGALFNHLSYPILADGCAGQLGPLAGLLTGLEWARDTVPGCKWVVSAPVDTPFLPSDFVRRLIDSQISSDVEVAVVSSAGRRHPVCALWPVASAAPLRKALLSDGLRKMGDWVARLRVCEVPFDAGTVDPFFNVNNPTDLIHAEKILAALPQGR
jgi:molybdenum cofactor guanylyltransferase